METKTLAMLATLGGKTSTIQEAIEELGRAGIKTKTGALRQFLHRMGGKGLVDSELQKTCPPRTLIWLTEEGKIFLGEQARMLRSLPKFDAK